MKAKTITNVIKKVSLVALALVTMTLSAQDEEKKWFDNFSLSGSVDGYFRTNLSGPDKTDDNGNFLAPGTSFANQNGFSLGMVNTVLAYEGEKVGFVADLVYGPRGTDAVFNATTASSSIVNQLYVYWKATESMTLTFGNFNTFLGYEVISPTGNFNYSTSYMFSYGPFSHTGLKADFAIDDNWSAMVSIMNPTDFVDNNPFDTYVLGAQLGYSADSGSAYLNFRYGNEGLPGEVDPTFQVDLTTGWDVSDSFYLGVNTTYLSTGAQEDDADASGFYGFALYPQIKTSESFTIGLRGEYFNQYNFGLTSFDGAGDVDFTPTAINEEGDGSVFAATLTGSYEIGSLTFKPELRFDTMSEDVIPVFIDNDFESSDNLFSFVLGAVYSF
ncbi:porin [Aquimarina sp. ERC-38]|uniref:outer membrane beta-barrel protein n=1 Tax=Aquimarina sp. ERC-38 TaxID=2949996 RepID=UPI0022472B11|nr:outer membrane beta-barrel protein [Aquimarina sp. ERC-38]UZO80923.1 porin [Aquimarina sp. ERC-38]